MLSYSARAERKLGFLGTPKDKTWFGVELEVACTRSRRRGGESVLEDAALEVLATIGDDFAITKSDGSIGYGFEIVTAPATLDIHRKRWNKFFRSMPHGLEETEDCGMHVHVSRPGPFHLGKMLVFMNNPKHEDRIVEIAGRSSSQWAAFKTKKLTDGKKFSSSRYEALNTCPDQTVEFRIFASTTDPTEFIRNLEFCHAVFYFCRDASASKMTWSDFTEFVRTHPHDYPALRDYLGLCKRAPRLYERVSAVDARIERKKQLKKERSLVCA